MWKDYSIGFIKKNRASSLSVLVAAFISALFLSLLCGLFYNFWNYEIESITLEEGDWQGRIAGTFEKDVMSDIENFANVKTAVINEQLSDGQTLVVDICFDNMRTVYQDMPLIAEQLGVLDSAVSYHESLLSGYFIHDPQDTNPPLLMAFFCIYECPCSSIWHFFQYRGNTWANSCLSLTGSDVSLRNPHFARQFYWDCIDLGNHTGCEYPCRWYYRQA